MGKTKKIKKPRENQQKTIFGDSLGKPHWQIKKTSREPKNKKNKTFQRMFGLRLMFVFFWFCRFFLFFWSWPWKNKKLKVFFGFWVFVALGSFWPRNEKPKKTLSLAQVRHGLMLKRTKPPLTRRSCVANSTGSNGAGLCNEESRRRLSFIASNLLHQSCEHLGLELFAKWSGSHWQQSGWRIGKPSFTRILPRATPPRSPAYSMIGLSTRKSGSRSMGSSSGWHRPMSRSRSTRSLGLRRLWEWNQAPR